MSAVLDPNLSPFVHFASKAVYHALTDEAQIALLRQHLIATNRSDWPLKVAPSAQIATMNRPPLKKPATSPEEKVPVEEAITLLAQTEGRDVSDVHLEIRPSGDALVQFASNFDKQTIRTLSATEGHRIRNAFWSLGTADSEEGLKDYSHTGLNSAPFTTFTYGGKRLPRHLGMIRAQFMDSLGKVLVVRLVEQTPDGRVRPLGSLGLDPLHLEIIQELAERETGGILVTGPVGHGKTTLIYGALQYEVDFRTAAGAAPTLYMLEDPPERVFAEGRQIPVTSDEDWKAATRAALRGAMDMGFIGEARSIIQIEAFTLWSRIVKAWMTFHAKDGVTAFSRLREEGVPPHNIADPEVYSAVISMRLVPILCPHCSTPWRDHPQVEHHKLTPILREFGLFGEARRRSFISLPGCPPACRNGIIGRRPIVEIVQNTERLGRTILASRDEGRSMWLRGDGSRLRPATSLGMSLFKMVAAGEVDPVFAHGLIKLWDAAADFELAGQKHPGRVLTVYPGAAQ
jgi:hypothetical protein